jgi:hypothetical protein
MNSTTDTTINENDLNEIFEQPMSHHLTSYLSTDAQYATLKVYEDQMHARLTSLFPHQGYLPRVSSARFSKSSHTTSSISAGGGDGSSKVNSTLNNSNSDEYRRFEVTYLIESAMKIIDTMGNFQRRKLNTLKASSLTAVETTSSIAYNNNSNYLVLDREVSMRNVAASSNLKEEDIIAKYSKWIDLWNKYLDEQELN